MTHIIISEWVNDECLTPSEQLFNHITIRVVAYRQDDSDVFFNMLSCYSANPLKQQSVNSPWIDMPLHLDTLSWLQANQSLV